MTNYVVLAGGTVYLSPSAEPMRGGSVLIAGDRIAAIGPQVEAPPESEVIDCSGLTVTAGFWNSHVHFSERKWMNAATLPASELRQQLDDMLTRYGFTSVFDLSSQWENTKELRRRIESGEVPGPRIRSTGEGLVPANPGLPSDAVLHVMGWMKVPLPEVADAVQGACAAKRLIEAGVDGIKLFVSSPSKATIPEDAMRAAVEVAHEASKPVFVHPNNSSDLMAAVRGGVDVIGHTTPASGVWDESVLSAMIERRVALTPTLTLWKQYLRHDRA